MYLKTKQEIQDLLQRVTADLMPLKDFEERFVYLLQREPYPILDHEDKVFFGEVLEKLGWTADNPTKEERSWGWIDFGEFKNQLRAALERYLEGEQVEEL